MAYPSTLETLPTGRSDSTPLVTNHYGDHNNVNRIVNALQSKIGVDSSAATTSIDYLLKNTSGGHNHDGSNSRKINISDIATGALAANRIMQVNSGGTEMIASSYSFGTLVASNLLKLGAGGVQIEDSGKAIPTGAIVGTTDSQTLTNKTYDTPIITNWSGWQIAGETWTYASATTYTNTNTTYSGTFTISGDVTSKYMPKMRVKFTQGTVKMGIITKVAYSAPNTTITVFFGTDYSMAAATITDPYYSMIDTPAGFPTDVSKWTVVHTDTSDFTTTSSTYSSPTGFNILVPVGQWDMTLFAITTIVRNSVTACTGDFAVSTANNSWANTNMHTNQYLQGASGNLAYIAPTTLNETLLVAADTRYYAVFKSADNATTTKFQGTITRNLLQAKCAYL